MEYMCKYEKLWRKGKYDSRQQTQVNLQMFHVGEDK